MPPRVQLTALPKYFHYFQRKVNVNDLNYMSHLDHAAVIKIIHEARVDCLRQMGLSERNLLPDKSRAYAVQMLINDLSVQYMNSGELFDDLIIESGFTEKQRCGFKMCHRIRSLVPIGSSDFPDNNTVSTNSNHSNFDQPTGSTFKPIALVEVGVVAVDAITKSPVELPVQFFEKLGFSRSELETHLTKSSPSKNKNTNTNSAAIGP